MRKRPQYWLLLLVSVLFGCSSYLPLQRSQTSAIARGADSAEISRIVGNASLLASHDFTAQGQQYRADHYDLLIGTRQQLFSRCSSRRRGCVPTIQHIPVTDSYVVIYIVAPNAVERDKVATPGQVQSQPRDKQKVVAWGTVEALSRSPDDSISSIMPALKASYAALTQRK